jgi:hypothetical protein
MAETCGISSTVIYFPPALVVDGYAFETNDGALFSGYMMRGRITFDHQ